jgi:hypothetical protein
MKIIEYDGQDEHWLKEIEKSDWGGGKYLYELLSQGQLKELCGENTKVLLLTEGEKLVSFCTYAMQDDIRDLSLTPWIGFVYTFPAYRGHRHVGKLLGYTEKLAKNDGYTYIYISTLDTGLYEKYGYSFWKTMIDVHGEDSRVYRKMTKIIASCGNDCSECPRYNAYPYEKTQEELRHTAQLWMKIGYRDHIVSEEEISCTGCKSQNWCRYNVVQCCEERGIRTCAECGEYPCVNMKECFRITKSFETMCKKVCTEEEYLRLKKAFFEKEKNLGKI